MIKTIRAVSRVEIERLKSTGILDRSDTSCISIIEPLASPVFDMTESKTLTLSFDDMAPDLCDSEEHFSRLLKQRADLNHPYILFNEDFADQIIAFALKQLNCCDILYVHCTMGIRRSGAVAQFLNEWMGGDKDKFESENAHIAPNPLVLRILKERACELSIEK